MAFLFGGLISRGRLISRGGTYKWDHLFANICIYSKFVEILFGPIPGVIIMYVTSILEKWLKSWPNTFVPCMYKFESMQAIYVSYH